MRDLFRSYSPKHQYMLLCLRTGRDVPVEYLPINKEDQDTFVETMCASGVLKRVGSGTNFTPLGEVMMRICTTLDGRIVV
jgi:hypothetical protein